MKSSSKPAEITKHYSSRPCRNHSTTSSNTRSAIASLPTHHNSNRRTVASYHPPATHLKVHQQATNLTQDQVRAARTSHHRRTHNKTLSASIRQHHPNRRLKLARDKDKATAAHTHLRAAHPMVQRPSTSFPAVHQVRRPTKPSAASPRQQLSHNKLTSRTPPDLQASKARSGRTQSTRSIRAIRKNSLQAATRVQSITGTRTPLPNIFLRSRNHRKVATTPTLNRRRSSMAISTLFPQGRGLCPSKVQRARIRSSRMEDSLCHISLRRRHRDHRRHRVGIRRISRRLRRQEGIRGIITGDERESTGREGEGETCTA